MFSALLLQILISGQLNCTHINAQTHSVNVAKQSHENAILIADRWSSLHPEQDPDSPSYSGRKAAGPNHGLDPHGGDLHDENHDYDLPANRGMDANHPNGDNYPTKDPYGGTVPR